MSPCHVSIAEHGSSPYLNHFTQPDSIVPDPSSPQDWNRYAYARNSPLKYTDPSGHLICNDVDMFGSCNPTSSPNTIGQVIKILKSYGANLSVEEGQNAEWSFQNAYKALDAVISIGNSIADTLGNGTSSSGAFKSVYTTGVNFMWMPRTCAIGGYTCWGYAGNFSITNPVIQIYEKYTTSNGFTLKSPITPELFVHELGHAFNVLGGRSPENYVANYTDRGGAHVLTDNRDGFASGYISGQDNSASEIFADMFVGWVYGAWASNHAGETRNDVMTTNMADWIIDAQNGH